MLNFLLTLVLAHLLGDFVFQSDTWVKHKKEKLVKSKYLYFHLVIHASLLFLLTQFQTKYLFGITAIIISHFLIDVAKLYIERKFESKVWFFVDQVLHLVVIAMVVKYYFDYQILISKLFETKTILFFVCITLLTYVSAILLKIILAKWDFRTPAQKNDTNSAGTYIGILERLFIFTFVCLNFWSGIGFLLAAKSIFRFGDLKESKDIKLTEYILIGTLFSFGTAIAISLFFTKIIYML